jgi:hypothetical protein
MNGLKVSIMNCQGDSNKMKSTGLDELEALENLSVSLSENLDN